MNINFKGRAGFTGSQHGITTDQRIALIHVLQMLRPTAIHHGDCVGADEAVHQLVGRHLVVLHPPVNSSKRAYCDGASEVREMKPYLDRNHDIVDETDYLIATPFTMTEELRSGTWATVRYARKLGRPIFLVFPDGNVKIENV